MPRSPRFLLLVCLALGWPSSLSADDRWQAIHREMFEALATLSQATFASPATATDHSGLPVLDGPAAPPWMIVVGFTGGLEGSDSSASGVVAMRKGVGQRADVLPLTFNNFRWRRAADEVISLVEAGRSQHPGTPLAQPLIVAYGHSWGAGSIAKFARQLRKHDLEISLAIYIDAFTLRNPRLPDNIRYAVNFYQRSGVLRGLPFRGKRKLLPEDADATHVLGEYRISPETTHWGWSWNLLQPLLYRHHHRIGHDVRLQEYLLEIISLKLQLLAHSQEGLVAERQTLFDKVVIVGASVSADERAPSPGLLLSRHLGTPEEDIHVFASGGANSGEHLSYLDNIARLQPSIIVALDLFYHDFKMSLFLSESRKAYLRDYVARLHDTGAVVVLGNVPNLVLLRHAHVNRYLESLTEEFPNLVLVDVDTLLSSVDDGLPIDIGGQSVVLRKEQLFADRVHPNLLGSTVMANLLQHALYERFSNLWPAGRPLLPLPVGPMLPLDRPPAPLAPVTLLPH